MLDVSAASAAPGREFAFEYRQSILPQEIMGETVLFPDGALFRGTFQVRDGELILRGVMEAVAQGCCARCLAPVAHPLSVAFEEIFLPARGPAGVPEDDAVLTFNGVQADLSHLAMSLAVLELPMRFLCGGPCHASGADGNPA